MEKQPTKLDYGLKKRSKSRRTRSILADTCHQYLNSFPGIPQTASTIRTFRAATSFLESGSAGTMTMALLQARLDYRLDATKMATTLRDVALPEDCEFPACHLFDYDSWRDALSFGERTPGNAKKSENYDPCFCKVHDAELFCRPMAQQGLSYSKPAEYLTPAFVENDLDERAVDRAIAAIQAYKKSRVETLTLWRRCDRCVKNTVGAAFRTLGKRLRSPWPWKRGVVPQSSSEIPYR